LAGIAAGVWLFYNVVYAISDDIRPDWAQHVSLFKTGMGAFDEAADISF
jgi:hypothetical protein